MPSPTQAFRPYKKLVEEYNQAVPVLLWGTREATVPVHVIPPEDWPEEASMTDLYAHCADQLIAELGHPSWAIISAEAWRAAASSMEEVESYRHGDLARMGRAGGATECVMITAVSMSEDWAYQVPFERQAHRVRWGEPEQFRAEGPLADLLRTIVR